MTRGALLGLASILLSGCTLEGMTPEERLQLMQLGTAIHQQTQLNEQARQQQLLQRDLDYLRAMQAERYYWQQQGGTRK